MIFRIYLNTILIFKSTPSSSMSTTISSLSLKRRWQNMDIQTFCWINSIQKMDRILETQLKVWIQNSYFLCLKKMHFREWLIKTKSNTNIQTSFKREMKKQRDLRNCSTTIFCYKALFSKLTKRYKTCVLKVFQLRRI